MSKFIAKLATNEDDKLLRDCLRNSEIEGSISVAFETAPSFFDAVSIQGDESQIITVKSKEEIAGFGVRSIKPMYFNGQPINLGYLSGLRGNQKFRNHVFLARGFKLLAELDQDNKVPFYITTIIEDNIKAKKILESGRAGLPTYSPIDILSTFLIKPRKRKKKHNVIKGNQISLEEIVTFLNQEGSKKQFTPYYYESDFSSARLRGLRHEDFYVAIDNSEIIGVVAKWDQKSFKQTRVTGYSKSIRIARRLTNSLARFTNIPYLPNPGKLLNYFYAAFPTTKNNNPEILDSLLSEISSDANNTNYNYFSIGLTQSDPLTKTAKSLSSREYRAKVYAVTFDRKNTRVPELNSLVPYLELATL